MRERLGLMLVALTFSLLLTGTSANADDYTFSLLPATGAVGGPPGSTVGWGYSITNDSTTYWLVTSGLGSDPFLDGTPNAIFDFPDLAPGATATENFDPAIPSGLFEFSWNSGAPIGSANSGSFDLSAQWWTGNPLSGGTFVMDASDALASYSATVTPAPEPSTFVLVLMLAGSFGALRLRRCFESRVRLARKLPR